MYSSDLFILDLSWKDKNSTEIAQRLKQVTPTRRIPVLDSHWTRVYAEAYTSLIYSGAKLTVTPFITSELLFTLLKDGPIFANICSTASSGKGRIKIKNLRESEPDDESGIIGTHSIVIYGHDEDGNFLIADPWDGLTSHTPEHLVLSIEAAQIECDNQIFVISIKV